MEEEPKTLEEGFLLPSKEKLARMQSHLAKLMRLVSKEENKDFKEGLTNRLLEVYITLRGFEKGEANDRRNSSGS